MPPYPTFNFTGIPGDFGGVESFAQEYLVALDFKQTGMYSMAVNTDWTGFPNGTDGYQVRAGTDPLSSASSVVLGFFDANAPAGPARGMANAPFQFYVANAGIYPFRLLYYQSGGSANLEWFILNPDGTRTLINDAAVANAVLAYYQWTTPPAAPTLSVTRTTGGLTITFQGSLQSADVVSGAYSDVAGATSPYAISASAAQKYYRARQ